MCAVKPWYETTCCGICLISDANLHWVSGRGGDSGLKMQFFYRFYHKVGVLLSKYSKEHKTIEKSVYHSKTSLFVSIKLVSLFHKAPLTAPRDCHWKGGQTVLGKVENTTCLIKFFFELVFWFISKVTIYKHISSFWCLKLCEQSISVCTAYHLHDTSTRNLHFRVLFVHHYLFRNDIIAPVVS